MKKIAYLYNKVLNSFVAEVPSDPKRRPYFSDGRRRIDFVLAYNYKKRGGLGPNNNDDGGGGEGGGLPASGRRDARPRRLPGGAAGAGAAGATSREEEAATAEKVNEEAKQRRREEFEKNLMDTGLEVEKDDEAKTHGQAFVRIHAPWNVLAREAEFLKIKMPTKKVYEIKPASGVLHKAAAVWHKVTRGLLPRVPDSQSSLVKHLSFPFSREKQHMFNITDKDTFFNSATRSRIVHEILKRTTCNKAKYSMGINSLLANEVYDAAYPLHDGDEHDDEGLESNDRKLLHNEWASYGVFYKYQPIELIRKYFGEKIGLYFAWLGVYTELLIPASLIGVIVFLYGCATIDENIPSMEMCDDRNNFTMCPLCDRACNYWRLSTVCGTARASHLFDNPATVFYAIFMALWATTFLEHWKRRQMRLDYSWDLTGLEDEEDHPRPEYEAKLLDKKMQSDFNKRQEQDEELKLTWRDRLPSYAINFSSILFMIGLTFAIVFALIVYRISVSAALAVSTNAYQRSNNRVIVTSTAVVINLIIILILDEIYGSVARWLTQIEVPKTDKEFEERLIFKSFLLKFVNSYTTIFYVAFFKGRFVGRPGSYVYVFPGHRMEECAPGGCLMELCIQLSIIMLGKQLIQNNLFEIGIPRMKKLMRSLRKKEVLHLHHHHHGGDGGGDPEGLPKRRWDLDHELDPYAGLTPEYMEMIIQFGFVTLFVASFPLAPLFALLNNVIEIRLDAKKFVSELRRPTAVRAKDIGIWFNILSGIGKLSVITNAFVISTTSDFIPRLVYLYMYSADGTMRGFVDHTLSHFNVSDFAEGTGPAGDVGTGSDAEVLSCRYKDYRDPPGSERAYDTNKQYWAVMAARLAFVIIFQNLVMFLSNVLDWLIPDIPKDIADCLKKERTLIVATFLKEEQEKMQLLGNLGQNKDGRERRVTRSALTGCVLGERNPPQLYSLHSKHTSG
ncbi:unnamed protein product [Lampetra fluviatilis]